MNIETGVNNPKIVSSAGETSYEFYSFTRSRVVCNKIIWYIMKTKNEEYFVNLEEGFKEAGFYLIEEAIDMITYSQDKSLVNLAYKRYLEFKDYQEKLNYT